ncbi:flagellar filament capping protein FliD [Geodermatophilus sp. URMC 64]
MAGVSMGTGLTSGIDYSTMITQLMQIEARPQTLLKSQLADTKTQAGALRQVNTAFAGLSSAAQALTKAAAWTPAKATSSSSTVTATASGGAQSGTLSFTVDRLAKAHSVVASQTWGSTSEAFGLGATLTFTSPDGTTTFGSVTPTDSDGDGTVTLADAVSAINKNSLGYTATAVNTGSGYQLQVTSNATGAAKNFRINSDTTPGGLTTALVTGQDAKIVIGDGSGTSTISATSATNTFTGVLDGTSFTVSQAGTSATITVGTDTGAITSAVKAMVDAANAAIAKVKETTDSSEGSDAALKGNATLTQLAGKILTEVSSAVGGKSPATVGIQLTRDGTITFDAAAFTSALSATPALAQSMLSGATGAGADNVAYTPDDTIDVDGLAARLSVLAEQASDSAAGVITALANGRDTRAKDIQSQIDAWDLRLQKRQETMTAQFNAMESALASLQSQSTWLTSQINSLPKWSSSSSS